MGPRYNNPNLQGLIASIFGASRNEGGFFPNILLRFSLGVVRIVWMLSTSSKANPCFSFFGMFPVAYSADRFGRRITIQLGAAVYMCALFEDPFICTFSRLILAWEVLYRQALRAWTWCSQGVSSQVNRCVLFFPPAIPNLSNKRIRSWHHVWSGAAIPGLWKCSPLAPNYYLILQLL